MKQRQMMQSDSNYEDKYMIE